MSKLCPKGQTTQTIEHNGGQWCPNCGKFAVPPTLRHPPTSYPTQKQKYSQPTLLTCSSCGRKDSMGDGLYDDREWMCGACIAGMAYPD
jgi:hypothetical protein